MEHLLGCGALCESAGLLAGTREPGGGQWGQLAPTTLKLWAPPNFGLSMSFFFFVRKNSGPNPGSF